MDCPTIHRLPTAIRSSGPGHITHRWQWRRGGYENGAAGLYRYTATSPDGYSVLQPLCPLSVRRDVDTRGISAALALRCGVTLLGVESGGMRGRRSRSSEQRVGTEHPAAPKRRQLVLTCVSQVGMCERRLGARDRGGQRRCHFAARVGWDDEVSVWNCISILLSNGMRYELD